MCDHLFRSRKIWPSLPTYKNSKRNESMGRENKKSASEVSLHSFETTKYSSVSRMTELTRGFITELGETGAGVRSEADIILEHSNEFTNKWHKYLFYE
jgi:hypothetical protein